MTEVFIAAAKRSPIGKLGGMLAPLSAAEIGGQVLSDVVAVSGIDPDAIDDVLIGQVLTGGAGQNPARQAVLNAGLPNALPAMTLNMVCGAGQRSIHLAAQAIKAGDAQVVLTGGQDSMSQAPHFFAARRGTKAGDVAIKDMMITDGLWDAFHDIHMGNTVEQLAERYQVTRHAQDAFALESQGKASQAISKGLFEAEITPIRGKDKREAFLYQHDEHPQPDTTLERLAAMRPVFQEDGTITAGNASGLNDGAAAILVCSEAALAAHKLTPLARVVSYAAIALAPLDMGLAPAFAARKALSKAGWHHEDLDVMEVNEAFAAQAISVNREVGWDVAKINPNGGAIALGHPLAASGSRIVVSLVHEMQRRSAKRGLATLCIGGGQSVALCLERP
ncbi:acetyl-CoA C-acetyltransferase [Cognatishimia sp. SS12]|uniref:acetyl-CoA C-acetyltransferase n=1 Tax=Cognatishimia sp. SS12 TaxID=2979465 RepID=UPI00232F0854|nr:acetyl-CoA C-acetyltransferase [Cognatishimia sp. SS12]MDC0738912.1 acetyl-CoA C-acetyltransferase [Cognatishimia sp. SS12]